MYIKNQLGRSCGCECMEKKSLLVYLSVGRAICNSRLKACSVNDVFLSLSPVSTILTDKTNLVIGILYIRKDGSTLECCSEIVTWRINQRQAR